MQNCRRGRNGRRWCYSRHRSHLGSRHCLSNAQADPKANGAPRAYRRRVDRCLSCMRRKLHVQFFGGGGGASHPRYPTDSEGLRAMGLFYTTFTTYGPDATEVVSALKRLRRSAFVSPTVGRATVIYDRATEEQDLAEIEKLGKKLSNR